MDALATLGSGRTAGSVLQAAELPDETRSAVEDSPTLEQLVDRLIEDGLVHESVRLLAHALPDREAVGWAWICAWEVTGPDAPDAHLASLNVTRTWIQEPSDEARREAMQAAELVGLDCPAGFVGFAAFCCGDSLAPADLPPAPPPEGIVGTLVSSCIAMSASTVEPAAVEATLEGFARRGVELAQRIQLWEELSDEEASGADDP